MPTSHIALVPEVGTNLAELASVSAALQKQVMRDLAPIWEVSATVDAFPRLEQVPAGYWPIVVTFRSLGSDEGIHIDPDGQPYSLIEYSPSWSLTASHVCLEMLTDPTGSRTFQGDSPRRQPGEVEFLLGICDPCVHADYGYFVNDVLVSDFCTPAFFERGSPSAVRRSFTGAVRASQDVLRGGHFAWFDPVSNCWWFRHNADDRIGDVRITNVGAAQGAVRELLARHVPHLRSTRVSAAEFGARIATQREHAGHVSQSRAERLRSVLVNAGKTGRPSEPETKARDAERPRPSPAAASTPVAEDAADFTNADEDYPTLLISTIPPPPPPPARATGPVPPPPPPRARTTQAAPGLRMAAAAVAAAAATVDRDPSSRNLSLTDASWVNSPPRTTRGTARSNDRPSPHLTETSWAYVGVTVAALAACALMATRMVSRGAYPSADSFPATAAAVANTASNGAPIPSAAAPSAVRSPAPVVARSSDDGGAALDAAPAAPAPHVASTVAPSAAASGAVAPGCSEGNLVDRR